MSQLELLPLLFMAFQVVTQLFNNLPQGLETGSANVMGKAISLPMSVIKTFHVAYEKALEENAVSNVKQVMDHVSNTECPNKLPRKISEMVPQEFADFMQYCCDAAALCARIEKSNRCVYIYLIYIYICVCVCMYICMWKERWGSIFCRNSLMLG